MLRVRTNGDRFRRSLSDVAKRQLPFAIARALTATAKRVQKAEPGRVERVLDRPTPFTKRGVGITPATKRRLQASVFYKDIQGGYLLKQEQGGVRLAGGRALLVPVRARLNRYGNLSRRQVQRLLARPDTFSGRVGSAAGIFQRMRSGKLKMLIAYEPRARYRARLGFVEAAERRIRRALPVELRNSLRKALATAR